MSMISRRFTWSSAAIVLLVSCGGGSSGGGANPDHAMDAIGGAGATTTSGGDGGGTASNDSGRPSDEHDAGSKPRCPPECLRAYTCAPSCNEPAVNNGCCPCPAGTIDTISCNTSGMAP